MPEIPYGTYGCWDYPNDQWNPKPTAADIPAVCEQKLKRYPENKLWGSHENCAEWFKNQGLCVTTEPTIVQTISIDVL